MLTEGEVFQDEILAGTERTDDPANQVSEPHDHGKNLTETYLLRLTAKSLILHVCDVLTWHRSKFGQSLQADFQDADSGGSKLELTQLTFFPIARSLGLGIGR